MNSPKTPQMVPTLLSSRVLVWSAVLVLLFAGLTSLYFSVLALKRVRAAFAEPVSTEVVHPALTVVEPAGWKTYAKDENGIWLFRESPATGAVIRVIVRQDESLRYQALDMNRALLLRRLARALNASGGKAGPDGKVVSLELSGSAVVTVRPGVLGIRFIFFDNLDRCGTGLYFLYGERSYLIYGLSSLGDVAARTEIEKFVTRPEESIVLAAAFEDIERPVVDSALLTPERNRDVLGEVDRELAMWRLFSERAETEPAAALLPAIGHFRDAVRLLSSIRQEATLLSGDEFKRYRVLLERRQATLREWFVLLDKFRAMRDLEGAKRQADFIRQHATLVGVAPYARRALDVYNEILNEEAAQQGGAQ